MVSNERRRVLQLVGCAGVLSTAGCLGLGGETGNGGNSTNSTTSNNPLDSITVTPHVTGGDKQVNSDWRNTNWAGGTPITEKPTTAWRQKRRFEFRKIRTDMTVKNNSVYYSSGNLQLVSELDTETGELKNTHSPSLSDPLTPVVHANRVFLSTATRWSDTPGATYLLESGESGVAWKRFYSFTPDSNADMTVYRSEVFVPGTNGEIGVIDVTQSSLKEVIQTAGGRVVGAPAVTNDLIVIGKSSVAEVYDKVTKSLLWSASVVNHHAPVVSESGIVFISPSSIDVYEVPDVSREKEEVDLNGSSPQENPDGEPITPHVLTDATASKTKAWEKSVTNEITSVAVTSNHVHVTIASHPPRNTGGNTTDTGSTDSATPAADGETTVRSYNIDTGDVAWETTVSSNEIIRSVVHQSVLYVIGSDRITGFNIATGEVVWEYQPPAQPQHPVTVTEDKLIYRVNDNELIAITN